MKLLLNNIYGDINNKEMNNIFSLKLKQLCYKLLTLNRCSPASIYKSVQCIRCFQTIEDWHHIWHCTYNEVTIEVCLIHAWNQI